MTTVHLQAMERSPSGNLTRRVLVPRVRRPQSERRFTADPAQLRGHLVLVRALFDNPPPFLQAPARGLVLLNPHGNYLEGQACTREPHQAVFQIHGLHLVHHLRHYLPNRDHHHVIRHIWALLRFVLPLHRHVVDPPLMPAGHRRVSRSVRRFHDTDHIGTRRRPHPQRHLLRPLYTHLRLPEPI
jgi:hypothetical protein